MVENLPKNIDFVWWTIFITLWLIIPVKCMSSLMIVQAVSRNLGYTQWLIFALLPYFWQVKPFSNQKRALLEYQISRDFLHVSGRVHFRLSRSAQFPLKRLAFHQIEIFWLSRKVMEKLAGHFDKHFFL